MVTVAGVSNKLQAAIDGCIVGGTASSFVSDLRNVHAKICSELKSILSDFDTQSVMAKIEAHLSELEKLLSGLAVFAECPSTVYCRIMGMGELMCAPLVEAVLLAKKQSVMLLDSRKFIFTTGDQKEGDHPLNIINHEKTIYSTSDRLDPGFRVAYPLSRD